METNMPQNLRIPANQQSWKHRYVAIFKCSPRPKSADEIEIADGVKISKNADLQRVLYVLQQGIISKKEYPEALKPTIRYARFQKPKSKGKNEAQVLLEKLRNARTDAAVRDAAKTLALRYVDIEKVQKGVLIFLLANLEAKGQEATNCIFIFKCDFEDISQLTPKQIFRRVEDAFEEHAKKGAQYPYFDGQKFDPKILRVFDALGETQYWLKFLELVLPLTQAAKRETELKSKLRETRPEIMKKYKETFESLSKDRPLAIDERVIETEDLLGFQEAQQIIEALPTDSRISLSLDQANVMVQLKEFGRKWMIAEQNGTHYVLIKGGHLELHEKWLHILDVSRLANLRQAKAALDIP
jgi:ribosomal protein L9